LRVRRPPAAQIVDRGIECLSLQPSRRQRFARRGRRRQSQSEQQAFDGHIAIACLFRDTLGLIEQPHQIIVETRRLLGTAARHRRMFCQCRVRLAHRNTCFAPGFLDQPCRHAFAVLEQRFQKMLGCNALMRHADRNGLRRLEKPLGAISEEFEVHRFPFVTRDMVLLICNTRADSAQQRFHMPFNPLPVRMIANLPCRRGDLFADICFGLLAILIDQRLRLLAVTCLLRAPVADCEKHC
jgi:hypothetical protein